MFFSGLIHDGPLPAVEKLAAFTEARHRVLAENIANVDTPGYRPKELDLGAFQAALAEALERRGRDGSMPLPIASSRQWRLDSGGSLQVQPAEAGPENILFHDRTNASVERQMTELVKNALRHQMAVELLRDRYEGLLAAIRGRLA